MSSGHWFKRSMTSPCCAARLYRCGIQNEKQRYRCLQCGTRFTEDKLFPERRASGKTTPPRYTPEFKPLNRDFDQHRKLAMVTR